jgi:hypothetical protein
VARKLIGLILLVVISVLFTACGCAKPWERVSMLNILLVKTDASGIEIRVVPRDDKGNIIPLSGSLDVKLWVYENPRGCGLCEGEFKQEWPDIMLTKNSYDVEDGARLILPFRGFYPEEFTLGALNVTLTQGSYAINGQADRLAIGTEVFS